MSRCWEEFLHGHRANNADKSKLVLFVFHSDIPQVAPFPLSVTINVLVGERCHWMSGASKPQRHPLRASSSLRLHEQLAREVVLLRYWPCRGATRLPHRILSCIVRVLTFWYWCPCMRLSPQCAQEDKTLVGDLAKREVGGRIEVYSAPAPEASPGLSRRVATAILCSGV